MKIIETAIPEVKIIELNAFGDSRGVFFENFHAQRYQEILGIHDEFVQDNFSRSQKNVLRGLHHQVEQPQGKLVTVLSGRVYDVAVDVRDGSPTYGHWVSVELSTENKRQFWIPKGFAHGFYVLSDSADFYYKCTDYYRPEAEKTLMWDDPTLDIQWPISGKPIISDKDKKGYYLK
jgi:dTDP-4-dehydrorhamnose 3,5-epimerase